MFQLIGVKIVTGENVCIYVYMYDPGQMNVTSLFNK